MKSLVILFAVFAASYAKKNPVIVGGSNANIASYPWLCSIRVFDSHFCMGVLINDASNANLRYVLTSYNCANYPVGVENVAIRAGNTDVNNGLFFDVENNTIHENYDDNPMYVAHNDIGLFKLAAAASGTNIQAATLGSSSDNFEGQICKFAGWGRTDRDTALFPATLQEGNYTQISNTECNNTFTNLPDGSTPDVNNISPMQMCAIDKLSPPNQSACDEDEGTALNCGGSFNTVAGILSFAPDDAGIAGDSCASNTPNVYTRVSSYRTWITNNTP